MKTLCLAAFVVLLIFNACFAREDQLADWSSGTAYILPAHRWETGLFLPLRMGLHSQCEFSTHPLVFFLMPNLSVKWSHGMWRGGAITTRHSIYYPTLLLRTMTRKGTGGIISPQFHIPHMISIFNELIFTIPFYHEFDVTGNAGLCFALKSGSLNQNSTIDLPIVFPRLNVFYSGYGLKTGMALTGRLYRRWHCSLDSDIFYYPSGAQKFAFEHSSSLFWRKNCRFQLFAGLKLSYAQFPFGNQWHLLAPLLDLQWGWNSK